MPGKQVRKALKNFATSRPRPLNVPDIGARLLTGKSDKGVEG